MDFLWLLMPIGCILMMLFGCSAMMSSGRPRNKDDSPRFPKPQKTGDDLGTFDQELQRRARVAGLSPRDVERLQRILNADSTR